ncbi:hypothetical protein N7493_005445 [Penicillium malachiteum]|uniref:Uncharacterized protein n=1 Tax=Penicillium malachiteum TaxID=1324776 RepID=A0AAD6HN68_9EURO|nr:hypothetical protein N7493_005445 [Penicillium malachiteum]
MNPPTLPGFYWVSDPEKKKYFKIEANHAASSSAYSADGVKRKRNDEENSVKRKIFDQRVANERIRRSSLLCHPFATAQRELGIQQPIHSITQGQICQTYLHGLEEKHLHTFTKPWSIEYNIAQIVRLPQTGTLLAAGTHGMDSGMSFVNPTSVENNKLDYNGARERLQNLAQFRVTSLSLSHTGVIVSTMDCGPDGESRAIVITSPESLETVNSPQFFHNQDIPTDMDMLCSAARPEGSEPFFALGTSDGLCTLEWNESELFFRAPPGLQARNNRRPNGRVNIHTKINSVDWLSENVVLGGRQNSSVFLHDVRSQDHVNRFQHPEPVFKVRKVDANRVVVMGEHAMNMYDLRFPLNGVQGKPNPLRAKHKSTRPYMEFEKSLPHAFHSMDVCTELGLLVNATAGGQVRMYSLTSGKVVYSHEAHDTEDASLGVVCFDQSTDQGVRAGEAPAVLFARGSCVSQLAW